jgi:mono/diheme cytochrome c family protein
VARLSVTAVALGVLSLFWLGCDAQLPDSETQGAVLYAQLCRGCHRLYAPSLLKPEMWKVKLDRMQGEMVRRGLPPLTPEERQVMMTYLEQHSSP